MSLAKLNLYFQTLRFVKVTQLYHQVYYRLKNRFFKDRFLAKPEKIVKLNFKQGILCPNTYLGSNRFLFLNLEKTFVDIDWNFAEYGKLWTYNLNYFEFLNQEGISKEQGVNLIKDYVSQRRNLKDGMEPYPISLRGISWVKFLAKKEIIHQEINDSLYQDYLRLAANLEYHLLANHLLENGFSLLFGAYYFKNEAFYSKAKKIIRTQLEEQILNDGAHYELSPMYHQIILHRVLDCINLVGGNSWKEKELERFLKIKAELMLGWLEEISFKNGEIPKLNDSATGITAETTELRQYASKLGIKHVKIKLNDSGYRKFEIDNLEIVMDVGQMAPAYQPGHSHADSLQFVLNYNNQPIIVDTGISTYEKNERRQIERSTASHNTVNLKGMNSSEVWGGFRVARRAIVSIHKENFNYIEASHNGYKKLGIVHTRSFLKLGNSFEVIDKITLSTNNEVQGHLHFFPGVELELLNNSVIINNKLILNISGTDNIHIQEYFFAAGFNKLISAKKLIYTFKKVAALNFQPN